MKGIMLCSVDGDYHGIDRCNPLGDYLENPKIGSQITSFFDYSVDPETQTIIYSLTNIDECQKIVKLLKECGENCETIVFCSCEEEISIYDSEFIGYDVCSQNIDDSPLAKNMIKMPEFCTDDDFYSGFYKMLDAYELKTYADDLNEYGLLNSYDIANMLCERCNSASETLNEIFFIPSEFTAYKVYLIK